MKPEESEEFGRGLVFSGLELFMDLGSYEGKIIEYLGSSGLKMGLVTGTGKGRLRVVDRNGRNENVALGKVLFAHPFSEGPAGFSSAAARLEQRIAEEAEKVDLELLWESVQGESESSFSVEDLTVLYFGEAAPERLSAVFRLVSKDEQRFKVRGSQVHPKSRAEVLAQEVIAEKKREKDRTRREAVEWLQRVLYEEESSVPESMLGIARALEDYLFRGVTADAERWLQDVRPREDLRETCFQLLDRLGLLPADADRFLLTAGIQASFSRRALQAAEDVKPFESIEGRLNLSHLEAFAIDDEETEEIDDALTVEQRGESLRVGIHIADVSHFVKIGDPLFQEALARRTSIYLPHARIPMLPSPVSMHLASLNSAGIKPAMSFLVDFDKNQDVGGWSIESTQIRAVSQISYEEVDAFLRGEVEGLPGSLFLLDGISKKLAGLREGNGAVNLKRPELKLKVVRGDIQVSVVRTDSPARRIVSELMILANQLAAQYAFLREVPVIYRVQGPPRQALEVPEHYDPVAYDRIFRQLEKSRFSLTRQSHYGLGLAGYTQLTSPIRRLGDLVIQQQITAHLAGEALPFEQQELLKVLVQAEAGEQAARSVERKAQRYYLYRYIKENLASVPLEAVVVMRHDQGYLVETVGTLARGRLQTEQALEPGDKVNVFVNRVEPDKELLIFDLSGKKYPRG